VGESVKSRQADGQIPPETRQVGTVPRFLSGSAWSGEKLPSPQLPMWAQERGGRGVWPRPGQERPIPGQFQVPAGP